MSLDLHQIPFKIKLNLKNKGTVAKLQISMSFNSAVKAAQVLIPRAKTEADRTVIHVCLPSVLHTKELGCIKGCRSHITKFSPALQ
jgi:hypothetical protein